MRIKFLLAFIAITTASSSSFAYYNNYNTFYQNQFDKKEVEIIGKTAGINHVEVKIKNNYLAHDERYVLTCAGERQSALSTSQATPYYYNKYLKLNITGLNSETTYKCQLAIEGQRCDDCGNKGSYQYNETDFFFIKTKAQPVRLSSYTTSSKLYRSKSCCGLNCKVYKNPYHSDTYYKSTYGYGSNYHTNKPVNHHHAHHYLNNALLNPTSSIDRTRINVQTTNNYRKYYSY